MKKTFLVIAAGMLLIGGAGLFATESMLIDFTQLDADIALCHNALSGQGMEDIQYKNIRTVRAGIGEIIKRKAEGFIEYTIE